MFDMNKALAAELEKNNTQLSEWTGEIGDQEVTLYAKPLSSAAIQRVMKTHKDFLSNPSPSAMVLTIIQNAIMADGTKAFMPKHFEFLDKMPMKRIMSMFNDLFADSFAQAQVSEDDEEEQEQEKNSETTG